MIVTVVIPTYRRPKDLKRCLEALKKQIRPADEVLVVVRDADAETWGFLEGFDPGCLLLRTLKVTIPGQVAALNAALGAAKGDIIAITDDDAAPHADWLARIETHFLSDDRIGGVGGRDWRYNGTQLEDGAKQIVGRLQWFGRVIGNHHLGVGEPQEVDILKGANMSYRRTAIAALRFDDRLRGQGAQTHNDMAFSLAVKRAGFKLIYDPAVAVDHYEAVRFDDNRIGYFDSPLSTVFDSSYNEALILWEYFSPLQRIIYAIWSFLIGTRQYLGLLQAIRFTYQWGYKAWQRYLTVQQGKFSALLTSSDFKGNMANPSRKFESEKTLVPAAIHSISVVIIAQNEEAKIAGAIRSCWTFADEIVVVDGGSQDSTVQCAQNLGCRVFTNPWPGYGKQRNFGAEKATHDWIFFLDCDEVVSQELAEALVQWKKTPELKANAFSVKRVGDFFDQWLDGTTDEPIRLYNKQKFRITEVLVHESPDVGDALVVKLPGILWHYGFRSINDHVQRFNKYTELEAQKLYLKEQKFNLIRLVIRPPARFFQKYLFQGMYRKGIPGLTVAVMWIYYEFLKEIKLYELHWQKNRSLISPQKSS